MTASRVRVCRPAAGRGSRASELGGPDRSVRLAAILPARYAHCRHESAFKLGAWGDALRRAPAPKVMPGERANCIGLEGWSAHRSPCRSSVGTGINPGGENRLRNAQKPQPRASALRRRAANPASCMAVSNRHNRPGVPSAVGCRQAASCCAPGLTAPLRRAPPASECGGLRCAYVGPHLPRSKKVFVEEGRRRPAHARYGL